MGLKQWLTLPVFYLCGTCYIAMRVYVIIFGSFISFYIVDVLEMGSIDKHGRLPFNLALIPLIIYFFSASGALGLGKFYSTFGHKRALLLGLLLCGICMTFLYLLTPQHSWLMYILAVPIGLSQALTLCTGINLISEVIGRHGKNGGVVFGSYSFVEKIVTGVIIYLVSSSSAYSKEPEDLMLSDITFIRLTLVLIPGASCFLGVLCVLFYQIPDYRLDK